MKAQGWFITWVKAFQFFSSAVKEKSQKNKLVCQTESLTICCFETEISDMLWSYCEYPEYLREDVHCPFNLSRFWLHSSTGVKDKIIMTHQSFLSADSLNTFQSSFVWLSLKQTQLLYSTNNWFISPLYVFTKVTKLFKKISEQTLAVCDYLLSSFTVQMEGHWKLDSDKGISKHAGKYIIPEAWTKWFLL